MSIEGIKSRPIVVGIGGASCSGKSTAAKSLHHIYQCKGSIVCQDAYATNPRPIVSLQYNSLLPAPDGDANLWEDWESLDTIDIDLFVSVVNDAVTTAQELEDAIVVVEGFLLFAGTLMYNSWLFSRPALLRYHKCTLCRPTNHSAVRLQNFHRYY